jgi:ribosomal protein S18 acetylase RimI-like enzyme
MTRRLLRYRELPAALLGRLAVTTRYRGLGLGELLLGDAARRVHLQKDIATMAVVVDAKDDAARAFYERHGFRRLLDDEYRLILPIAATGTTPARGSE